MRMGVLKSNHCAYDAHYHAVFPVKYRKALLSEPVKKAILEIAEEISRRYEIDFERIGTDGDHIHILLSFHPKYSGGRVVGLFKEHHRQAALPAICRNCAVNFGEASSGATAITSPRSATAGTGIRSSATSKTRERRRGQPSS